jgi:hypothetical protein
MFEKASRLKLRFETPKGAISVEDLWDIPLTGAISKINLDDIARGLHKRTKSDETISFVEPSTAVSPEDRLAFEVVKHVITVRLAENVALAQARANKEKKQALLGILTQKQNEQLSALSIDELQKQIEAL